MTHMIMDPRDRDRLWEQLRPFSSKAQKIQRELPAMLWATTMSPAGSEMAKACGQNLATARDMIDRLEKLHQEVQVVYDAFVPQFPEVPLVGLRVDAEGEVE